MYFQTKQNTILFNIICAKSFFRLALWSALSLLPQSLPAKQPSSQSKLYDLNNSIDSYMYYVKEQVIDGKVVHKWVQSKNESDEHWSISFEEHNLVKAEEVLGPDGKYYLRIPYGGQSEQKEGSDVETPYFLIPQYPKGERVLTNKINEANYQVAYPGEKRIGATLTDREDNLVYPNISYQKRLPLAQDPQDYVNECIEGAKGNKCNPGPGSQDKLKVIDTKILITKSPDSKKQYMELYYQVEGEYTELKCKGTTEKPTAKSQESCSKKKTKFKGWTPVETVIDFKREPENIDNTVSTHTTQLINKIDKKLKALPKEKCTTKKIFNYWPEDIALVLNQASQHPVNTEDLGACLGRDHINKMNDSDDKVESKFQKRIDDANKISPKNYSSILKLEHLKNKERLKKMDDTWTASESPFDVYVRQHWEKKFSGASSNKSINKDQMLSIDALARTLYGEMREAECSGDTSSYYKEIARVILNRAAIVKAKGGAVEKFVSDKSLSKIGDPSKASIFKILPHVISSPSQISSWNTNDDNLRNNLCPDPKSSAANSAAWELAKAVAIEAVMDTKTFLDETNNLSSALFYASKIRPYWEDDKSFSKYGAVNIKLNLVNSSTDAVEIYNQNVYNPNCVKLYKNKKYSDDVNEINKMPNKYYSQNINMLTNGLESF
jgi:hypothetical protein